MQKIKPAIAISACLLGQPVRYDGETKKQPQIVDFFINQHSGQIELIPFCPEVGIGLGVPRAKIQLTQRKDEPIRVLGVENHTLDVTVALQSYAHNFLQQYPDVRYFIVKARSPSCGYQSTPLFRPVDYEPGHAASEEGESVIGAENNYEQAGLTSGQFVRTILELKPDLIIVDESALISEQGCFLVLQKILSD